MSNHKYSIGILVFVFIFSCTTPKANLKMPHTYAVKDSIEAGKSIEISYFIHNTGSKKLVIEKYTCSCECTFINLKKNQEVLPNDSIEVKSKINTTPNEKYLSRDILCTFKANTDSIFHNIHIKYTIK